MPASRRLLFAALAICILSTFAAAQSDDAVAERVLGPEWKQLSRRAGMIFAGTVLTAGPQTARTDRTVPAIELTFRVERAIAGVEPGQVLTIHEWAGASSLHRPMRAGDRILIFFYPPSRLGLTSPVGGSRGQIALDASGQNVVEPNPLAPPEFGNDQSPSLSSAAPRTKNTPVTVIQLERAIRAARGE